MKGTIEELQSIVRGTTYDSIRTNDLANFLTVSTSYIEQKQIAKYLDEKTEKIEHEISKNQKLIELLKEEKQSLINHIVIKGLDPSVILKDSRIEWIGKIPEHWKISKLKLLLENHISYGVLVPIEDPTGVPMIMSTGLEVSGGIDKNIMLIPKELEMQYRKTRLKGNEILMAVVGSVGQCTIISDKYVDYNVNRNTCVIRIKSNNFPKYFLYYFKTTFFKHLIDKIKSGSVQPLLNLGTLSNLDLPLSPPNEQKQIVDYLDEKTKQIDSLISKVESQIQKLKELKQYLISSAVTGKICVTN